MVKKSSISKFDKFWFYLSLATVRGQKKAFNSCECIKFSTIANFYAFHVWEKQVLTL